MRNLTPEMAAELTSAVVSPALLAVLEFDSGTLYMWSGLGNLEWQGNTYLGGGNLVEVSAVEETQELQARGLICTLNGIPESLISVALSERTRGRPFRLYLGMVSTLRSVALEDGSGIVMTEDGGRVLLENQLTDSPYRLFTGLMDKMELSDTGDTASINLSVENRLIVGQRNKVRRYTTEDQKKLYPLDKGFEFIPQLQDKQIAW